MYLISRRHLFQPHSVIQNHLLRPLTSAVEAPVSAPKPEVEASPVGTAGNLQTKAGKKLQPFANHIDVRIRRTK